MQISYSFENIVRAISVERRPDGVELVLDDTRVRVSSAALQLPRVTIWLGDKLVTAYVIQAGNKRWVHVNGRTIVLTRVVAGGRPAHHGGSHQGTGSGIVTAPMPGQVRQVLVEPGAKVAEAQPLFILEAMKMELKVLAPCSGVVTKINVAEGASVEREQILGEIKETT